MAGFTRRNVRLRDLSSYLWKVACVAGMKRGIEGGRAGMEAGGAFSSPTPSSFTPSAGLGTSGNVERNLKQISLSVACGHSLSGNARPYGRFQAKVTKPRYEVPRTPLLSAMLNESLHTYRAKTVEIM